MMPSFQSRRWISTTSVERTLLDDQVPCSERFRQRVRLETEQPTWIFQVPWITWSSRRARRPDGREHGVSYRVLARTYRSGTFDEVVGQEAVATTLKNAIASGRVHHGYLFTGTRGVGKTSMARILAKAMNCLAVDGPTPTPCCRCASCAAVAEGEDIDVVEIDAASNTGVDNIRELRGNAVLKPARARFKIYIIDEVHMLSSGAFNALLKTLEEPPSHVKFILATTESQKVPATIQSRCQRFDFQAINVETITNRLRSILDAEKIEAEDAVLRRVARLAAGSMRDALSLLDKLIAYEAKKLTVQILEELLPPPNDELAFSVMEAVTRSDPAAALRAVEASLQSGRTAERFCEHLMEHVRALMLMRVCGQETELVDVASNLRAPIMEQSLRFDAPTFVYMLSMLEELRRNVKSSGAGRALVDAAVVRLSMSRQFSDISDLIRSLREKGAPRSENSAIQRAPSSEGSTVATNPRGATPPSGNRAGSPTASEASAAGLDSREFGLATSAGRGGDAVHSADRQRVARDPVVQRVKQSVDGRLVDVLPGLRPAPPSTIPETGMEEPAGDSFTLE